MVKGRCNIMGKGRARNSVVGLPVLFLLVHEVVPDQNILLSPSFRGGDFCPPDIFVLEGEI